MADAEVEQVTELKQDGTTAKKRRFDKRDWSHLADYVISEYMVRKDKRTDRERQWKEIDRQLRMEPEVLYKKMPDGSPDLSKVWMAEMELPLQAQTLEVLTADARKMMFPDSGPWFAAHAELTDDYLQRVDWQTLVLGDKMEVPTRINQDNADKLVESFLANQFRQYDFMTRVDRINAEAFKYGCGVGRARMETKNIVTDEAMGSFKVQKRIPVLHPCSIKNVYIDDPLPSMHSAQMLSPCHISVDYMRLENLQLAANKGSTNPDDADGGWMPGAAATITPDKDGFITVIEMEGDIVIPRKTTRSFVLHGAIATVVLGSAEVANGKATRGVVRFRWRKSPFSSYLIFPYHYEGADDHYPTGPLVKGMPIQMMCTDSLNRMMDSAALKNAPPIGYSRDDATLKQQGGPQIHPNAQWETVEPLKVYSEVGGDPAALAQIFQLGLSLYGNVTGVLPPRLGAQSVSHTTAFSKQAEVQQGASRTVDYTTQTGKGPITRWLDMSYRMARDDMKPKEKVSFYIPEYGGYVEITKDMLPEAALFEWFGAGGAAEEATKMNMKMSSLQMAMKMDAVQMQVAAQSGQPVVPKVNIAAAITEVLRQGTWNDLDLIVNHGPTTPGQPGAPPAAGLATVALQSLPQGALPPA